MCAVYCHRFATRSPFAIAALVICNCSRQVGCVPVYVAPACSPARPPSHSSDARMRFAICTASTSLVIVRMCHASQLHTGLYSLWLTYTLPSSLHRVVNALEVCKRPARFPSASWGDTYRGR
ncbi:hypothetical protein B0H19DRAFT_1112066 [Mycena capillaripes]|nr:hypothetical protein B0H19DRAFT_1112066 [Mycena capillaripes]